MALGVSGLAVRRRNRATEHTRPRDRRALNERRSIVFKLRNDGKEVDQDLDMRSDYVAFPPNANAKIGAQAQCPNSIASNSISL